VKLIPFPVQSDAEIERAFTGFATEPNGAIIAVSVGDCCATLRKDHSLVLAFCNTEAMQLHLDEISTKVSARAHAILILDQAGWHARNSGFPAIYRSYHCRRVHLSSTLKRRNISARIFLSVHGYAWPHVRINVEAQVSFEHSPAPTA
jgi:hypothetical protein